VESVGEKYNFAYIELTLIIRFWLRNFISTNIPIINVLNKNTLIFLTKNKVLVTQELRKFISKNTLIINILNKKTLFFVPKIRFWLRNGYAN